MRLRKLYRSLVVVAMVLAVIVMAGYGLRGPDYKTVRMKSIISKTIETRSEASVKARVELFSFSDKSPGYQASVNFVKKPVFLSLKKENVQKILTEKPSDISFIIPLENGKFMEVIMTRVTVLSKDFKLISKLGNSEAIMPFEDGVYYRGTVPGREYSLASVSIFRDFVMGLISVEEGNYVLGPVKDNNNGYTDEYIFYNDMDMLVHSNFVCGVGDNEGSFVRNFKDNNRVSGDHSSSLDTVDVYFVADYQTFLDNGSNINLTWNFVAGFFNHVALLYQNEGIPFKISNIYVHQAPDPYVNDSDSYDILLRFGYNTRDNFNGDLAHLISTGHNQALGGIAWINVLCTPYNEFDYSGRFGFSNIEDNYMPYPTYSWTVMVVTHEIGHNMGSYHTHACHWPQPGSFDIGPIDTCVVTPENSSYYQGCVPILPSNGCVRPTFGTIMSYCHFCEGSGGGISFVNGFGPYPGDTVRSWFNAASCLHTIMNSSENPVAYELQQNYPNPFNPVTNIRFALPSDGVVRLTVYDINGRETAVLIDSRYYKSGIHGFSMDAGAYKMASGVYFYSLKVEGQSGTVYSYSRKMVLVK